MPVFDARRPADHGAAPNGSIPLALRLHWTLVLLLSICTAGLFLDIWAIVQSLWVRKFERRSSALALYVASMSLALLGTALSALHASDGFPAVLVLVSAVISVFAAFSVRDTLSRYISGMTRRPTYLSGVMTIFLGPVYLQFHMNRVRSLQRHTAVAGAR